jgi:hypothetical protein
MVVSDVFPFGLGVSGHNFVYVAARAESSPYVQALDPIAVIVGHTNGVATTKAHGETLDSRGSHGATLASLATASSSVFDFR